MDHPNPLDVGELIAQCIDHLGDSSQDLKACALVSRRWVYAAQSQLFKAVTVSITHVDYVAPGGASAGAIYWARFLGTLRRSSHLTRHIQTLNLMGNGDPAVIPALSQICNFPFTHLENVFIFVTGYLTFPHAVAFQPLLSVPTLRRVKSFFTFKQISNFVQIWDGCAPGVRHVELFFEAGASSQQSSQAPPPPAHIVLESLRMTSEGMTDYRMTHNLRLFDLSRLRVLSIHRRTEFPWQHCSQTLQGIEALDIFSNHFSTAINLSSFPKLLYLRISVPSDLHIALQILSSITPSNMIRSITLVPHREHMISPWADCDALDERLSSLPVSETFLVQFETDATSLAH